MRPSGDYTKKFQTHGSFEPFAPRCPAQTCIALKGVQPGAYKGDGDGRPRLVFFERDEPEFPGLIFESPLELPKPESASGPAYYHPAKSSSAFPASCSTWSRWIRHLPSNNQP